MPKQMRRTEAKSSWRRVNIICKNRKVAFNKIPALSFFWQLAHAAARQTLNFERLRMAIILPAILAMAETPQASKVYW